MAQPEIEQIFYATNRAISAAPPNRPGPNQVSYQNGNLVDALSYGIATVALRPPTRVRGTEGNSAVTSVQPADWSGQVQGKEVLVYVHGYNNSFEDAVKKAAQVKRDMPWENPTIVFSWPSHGETLDYAGDEVLQGISVEPFVVFMRAIQGAAKIHVLSHSMGNRITSVAFATGNWPGLGQLIFAAADEDVRTFRDRLLQIGTRGEGRTLYASSQDAALQLSAALHDGPRAGQVWPVMIAIDYHLRRPFVTTATSDTIDCSGLDVGVLTMNFNYDVHGYFAQPPTLDDIQKVLQGQTAAQRVSANGQGGLTPVQAQPNNLPGPLVDIAGPPPVPEPNLWYRLQPLGPVPQGLAVGPPPPNPPAGPVL